MKSQSNPFSFEQGEIFVYPDELLNVAFERAKTDKARMEILNWAMCICIEEPPILYDVVEIDCNNDRVLLRKSWFNQEEK